ncbi:MAG TPA: DUF3887 domain-containing protein [Clostridiales bacterium]|nr:DUF3887 domain-containing protein [Clostridiales bacterium]
MKRLRLKLLGILVLVLSVCLAFVSGCGSGKLSDDFDEEQIKKATVNVIHLINRRDSQSLRELCNEQMKEALTDNVLGQLYQVIGQGGALQEMGDITVVGMTDETSKEELAVAVVKAEYENKVFTFTVTFTKQMKLAGLYYT